jgi:hypothetical protein
MFETTYTFLIFDIQNHVRQVGEWTTIETSTRRIGQSRAHLFGSRTVSTSIFKSVVLPITAHVHINVNVSSINISIRIRIRISITISSTITTTD